MAFAWPASIVKALHAAADLYGLEHALVRAVCYVESRGKPDAVSPKGAQGLMQLMPLTASSLGVLDAFDPEQNAQGGAKYLAQLIQQFGDVRRALWAYNWGPGNVTRKSTVPDSVQKYANDVLARAEVERRTDPLAAPPQQAAGSLVSFLCPHCGCGFAVAVVGGERHGA